MATPVFDSDGRRRPFAELLGDDSITVCDSGSAYRQLRTFIAVSSGNAVPAMIEYTFDRCDRGGTELSGSLYVKAPREGSPYPSAVRYSELSVTASGGEPWTMSGNLEWSVSRVCPAESDLRAVIRFGADREGQGIALDLDEGPATESCGPRRLSGVLQLDGHGTLEVTTDLALPVDLNGWTLGSSPHPFDPTIAGDTYPHSIELRGDDFSSSLSFPTIPESAGRSDFGRVAQLSIALHGTIGRTRNHRFLTAPLRRGALSDFGDADEDGLPDGWEIAYGLSPADPNDAALDLDRDGQTNLREYLAITPPDVAGDAPSPAAAYRVDVKTYIEPNTGRHYIEATTTVDPATGMLWTAPDLYLVVENATWSTEPPLPDGCELIGEFEGFAPPGSIRCPANGGDLRNGIKLRADTDEATLITVRAVDGLLPLTDPAPGAPEPVSTDHPGRRSTSIYLDRIDRELAIVDVERTSDITIRRGAGADPSSITIVGTPSGDIELASASLRSSRLGPLSAACSVGAVIRCTSDELQKRDTLTLEYRYALVSETAAAVEWEVAPAAVDRATGAVGRTVVDFVGDTALLQPLLDAAKPGDTVRLPAGRFMGTLNGRDKTVRVEGAAGAAGTALYSTELDRPIVIEAGFASEWANIHWRTTGAPIVADHGENLTLEGGTIEPVLGMSHRVANLVGATTAASYRLHGMRVVGFGRRPSGICRTLIGTLPPRPGHSAPLFIRDNLFVDNDCGSIISADSDRQFSR